MLLRPSNLTSDAAEMTENEVEAIRDRYIATLSPLFFPEDAVSHDIIRYFASLLRIVGMEDGGWDPHLESRALLEDLNSFMQLELPEARFPDAGSTAWRLGLLFYSHIVEMDAPYEVLANLLRFRLGKGYRPNPFLMLLTDKERKAKGNRRLSPKRKIEFLRQLGAEAGVPVAALFDEFYDGELRNAIAHSDFILTDESFRSRGGPGGFRAFSLPLARVNEVITKAKVFVGTFLGLDVEARRFWGTQTGRGIPYDATYKGLMEVLVDGEGLLCGFKVHWPNNSESVYRRTADRVEMTNCMLDLKNATVDLFVGLYARHPGPFSPLVEIGQAPVYTPLESSGERPHWQDFSSPPSGTTRV
jgi:hypothetical protein